MTGTTTAVAPSVDLVALITPANSTAQIFAGTTYYGTNYANAGYGPQQVVPFFLGPQGIADAVKQSNGEPTVILASGWGAGQTGTALGMLQPEDLENVDLVILDNNSNRAGGGFWTTYAPFAPLLFTSAEPTPDELGGLPVLDVAYEYNINSNAPTYPANVVSIGNSLVAYAYGYGAQENAELPPGATAEIAAAQAAREDPALPAVQRHHYVVRSDGTVDSYAVGGDITYVTYESENLPLLRPLRLIPGGDIVADALEPTLTEIVDAGYQDGQPIPDDPSVPRPMGLLPPPLQVNVLAGSVQDGLEDGVETAQDDVASPGNFVTKPLNEAGKLPVLSSLANTVSATNRVSTTGGNKVFAGLNKPGATSSPGGANPGQKFVDRISDAVNRVTGGPDKTNDAATNSPEPQGP